MRLKTRLSAAQSEARKLAKERDILRLPANISPGDELVNRFQFVEDHKNAWSVKRLREVVSRSRGPR